MPDSFFASEKKRKRPSSGTSGRPGPSKQPYSHAKPYQPYGKGDKSSLPSRNGGVDPESEGGPSSGLSKRVSTGSKRKARDEELESDDEGVQDLDELDFGRATRGNDGDDGEYDSAEEERNRTETAASKRIRLAKSYLQKVTNEVTVDDGTFDAAEIDRDLIASRLQQDVDEATGRIHAFISSAFSPETLSRTFIPAVGSRPVTSSCVSLTHLYTANKNGTICRYNLSTLKLACRPFGQAPGARQSKEKGKARKKQVRYIDPKGKGAPKGHVGEILCVAATEDGRYLVSGGRDKLIGVWEVGGKEVDAEKGEVRWLRALSGHKDAVTSLAIPPLSNPSHHVLAASLSRHLTLHSLSTLSMIDTFFGHQDSITSVSSLKPTLAVTAGSRDRTCRWWKVEEEIQLVFRGGGKTVEGQGHGQTPVEAEVVAKDDGALDLLNGTVTRQVNGKAPAKGGKGKAREFFEGSVDVVCMLDDSHFVSGGDSGSLSLWHTGKKKPIFTYPLAHGLDEIASETEGIIPGTRWITSLAALRGTDLFASGSWNGSIRLWALEKTLKGFRPVFDIPAKGFVNSLQLIGIPHGVIASTEWGKKKAPRGKKVRAFPDDVDMSGNAEDAGDGAPPPSSDDEADDFFAEPIVKKAAVVLKPGAKAKQAPDFLLVAAVAREPRLGRWMKVSKGVRDGTLLVHLKL